jgi:hypothetical protein
MSDTAYSGSGLLCIYSKQIHMHAWPCCYSNHAQKHVQHRIHQGMKAVVHTSKKRATYCICLHSSLVPTGSLRECARRDDYNTVSSPTQRSAASRNYIEPTHDIKLYDYIIRVKIFIEFYMPTQTSPRATSTWSSVAADKNPAAAVIFDCRRCL